MGNESELKKQAVKRDKLFEILVDAVSRAAVVLEDGQSSVFTAKVILESGIKKFNEEMTKP